MPWSNLLQSIDVMLKLIKYGLRRNVGHTSLFWRDAEWHHWGVWALPNCLRNMDMTIIAYGSTLLTRLLDITLKFETYTISFSTSRSCQPWFVRWNCLITILMMTNRFLLSSDSCWFLGTLEATFDTEWKHQKHLMISCSPRARGRTSWDKPQCCPCRYSGRCKPTRRKRGRRGRLLGNNMKGNMFLRKRKSTRGLRISLNSNATTARRKVFHLGCS